MLFERYEFFGDMYGTKKIVSWYSHVRFSLIVHECDRICLATRNYADGCYLKLNWDYDNLEEISDIFLQKKKIIKYIEKSRHIYFNALSKCGERAKLMILDEL